MALQRTQSLTTTKIAPGQAENHIGMKGELTVTEDQNGDIKLYLHDGVTPGGYAIDAHKVDGGWAKAQADADQNSGPSIPVEFLVVGGGGGGGGQSGGGGGAGGFRTGTLQITDVSNPFAIAVGVGGSSGISPNTTAGNEAGSGGDSIFGSIISNGGGGAGGYGNPASTPSHENLLGGSGGGGGGSQGSGQGVQGGITIPITPVVGETTTFQGYAGGTSISDGSAYSNGGGGGAGSPGGSPAGATSGGGNGGDGASSSITGTNTVYAAGGGGAAFGGGGSVPINYGIGGSSIGGDSGGVLYNGTTTAGNGQDGTGSGGGGAVNANGGAGGSGIIILAYPISFPEITIVDGDLTSSMDDTTRSDIRIYSFTAGSGNISFSLS